MTNYDYITKVEISATEWKRMREQRELLFDHNAPSAVIHQKGREKEERKVSRLSQDHSSSQKTQDVSGQKQKSRNGVTNIDEVPEKKKKTKSSGGWFKRKKKSSVTSCDSNDAPATVTATGTGLAEAVTIKRGEDGGRKKSFGRKKERKVQEKKEAGKKQATLLQTSPGSSVSGRKGEQQRRVEAGEEEDGRVTSIDDEDEEERGEEGNGGQVKVKDRVETERVRKAFSYEGPPVTRGARAQRSYVSTNLPRSKSHQTSITVQPQSPVSVEAPVIAHHRSKSYQEEEDGGGREGGWGGTELSVAATTTSESQPDISDTRPASKVEIDSNVRMKKSGVVKGVSSRGVGQRPTLEVSYSTAVQ